MKYYTQQVWQISDIIKCIGNWKHQFECASDRERLNNCFDFQHLLYHVFNNKFDTYILLRLNTHRLTINICFCNQQYIDIIFRCFEKYKRKPYYYDNITFNRKQINNKPLSIQYKLAQTILNDNMLLPFFQV